MTDQENKLIGNLMNGDMAAFDELMPNADKWLRDRVEFIVKDNNPVVSLLMALMPSNYCCNDIRCENRVPSSCGMSEETAKEKQ